MSVYEKVQILLLENKVLIKEAEVYRLKWELAKREIKDLKKIIEEAR